MNLYRSFGNLMEAWVAEQIPDPELLEDIPKYSPTRSLSSSGLEKNMRAESVDSGVETASTDTFCPNSSLSTDMVEMDSFGLGVGSDDYIPFSSRGPASLPPYSSLPALSQPTSPIRVKGSVIFNPKLRQALQRSESWRLAEPHAAHQHVRTVSRHRAPMLRSESFGSWETARPSVSARQMSDTSRPSLTSRRRMNPMQDPHEVCAMDLSPGLKYLEQVCQMWEDVANQQLANSVYHVDRPQASSSYQSLHQELSFHGTRLEQLSNNDQQFDVFPYGRFRQRSASDTTIPSTQPRKFKLGSRGQQLSVFNRLEKEAQDNKIQDDIAHKSNKNWKMKFTSLKRDEPSLQNPNSQLMQSLERNAARRQLSQLFRKRRRTLPVLIAR